MAQHPKTTRLLFFPPPLALCQLQLLFSPHHGPLGLADPARNWVFIFFFSSLFNRGGELAHGEL